MPSSSDCLSFQVNIFSKEKGFSLGMSNCRQIEVFVITSSLVDSEPTHLGQQIMNGLATEQERLADVSLMSPNESDTTSCAGLDEQTFNFMGLPVELRLKVFRYLFPSRTHTIVTQIPLNGYFYNTTSVPANATQSFYPFGHKAPSSSGNLTTYKVLSTNIRSPFFTLSLHPHILRVCKQIHQEAEPILYGSKDTVFDFGIYSEALIAFMGERSQNARACVRNIKLAREIPCTLSTDERAAMLPAAVDERWARVSDYIKGEFHNLRELDLTVWTSSGSTAFLPSSNSSTLGSLLEDVNDAEAIRKEKETQRQWREWDWTKTLLEIEALQKANVTWWGFSVKEKEGEKSGFHSWIAGRMVGDHLVRDRMVKEGVVVEGVTVLSGKSA